MEAKKFDLQCVRQNKSIKSLPYEAYLSLVISSIECQASSFLTMPAGITGVSVEANAGEAAETGRALRKGRGYERDVMGVNIHPLSSRSFYAYLDGEVRQATIGINSYHSNGSLDF
jgi:hypothetical protein